MIEEQATVLRADSTVALLQPQRSSGCGSCSATGGCGTSLLDRFLGRRPLTLEVDNSLGVTAGDAVTVGISETVLLRAAVAAYLGPLLGLMIGAVIGRHLPFWTNLGELPTLAGAVLGFALMLRLAAAYGRTQAADPRCRPVLLRRESPSSIVVPLR
jgi:sigma-E factor negative regulatory protein RseC